MQTLVHDIRYALRQLRKAPGFTLTAVLTLALGIGATTAMFSVLDEVLLRPFPYIDSEHVVTLQTDDLRAGISLPNLKDWQAQSKTISAMAGYQDNIDNLRSDSGTLPVFETESTASLFDVFRVQPALGRAFRSGEDAAGHADLIILSDKVWRTAFSSDRSVVGRKVTYRSKPFTVIGVMPPRFNFPVGEDSRVYTLVALEQPETYTRYGSLAVVARIGDGTTIASAAAELSAIQKRISQAHPKEKLPEKVIVTNYRETTGGKLRKPLLTLYAAVLAVWLIACINVAGLLLARYIARAREFAIRGALGASRTQIVRQLLTETALLSLCGASAGVLLAFSILRITRERIQDLTAVPLQLDAHPRVLLVALALSLLSVLIAGLYPAVRFSSARAPLVLHANSANVGASRTERRTRDGLVVLQLALTLVLLVAAGLLQRSLYELRHVPLGFSEENVLTGSIIFPPHAYDKQDVNTAVEQPLLARIRALPGVRYAAVSSVLPMRGEFQVTISAHIIGKKLANRDQPHADLRIASADFTNAIGLSMQRGRFFTAEDTATSRPVAVINAAFAKRYFAEDDPLKYAIGMGKGRFHQIAIIGVVDDVKQTDLRNQTSPEMYLCAAQVVPGTGFYNITTMFTQLAVRSNGPSLALAQNVRRILGEVAPDASIGQVKTMHQVIEDSIGSDRLAAQVVGMFAFIAIAISLAGLYGTLAYRVTLEARDIGVRMALGADRTRVLIHVYTRAIYMVLVGISAGIVAAFLGTRFIRSFLFGIPANDYLTILAVSLLMLACALIATFIPARRAASIDPMQALRSE